MVMKTNNEAESKPAPYPDLENTERHMQFITILEAEDKTQYGRKVDGFLYDVFDRQPPLRYATTEIA